MTENERLSQLDFTKTTESKHIGTGEIDKEWRFRVIGGQTSCMNTGDVIRPIKLIGGKWQIGHSYRESLPFVWVEDGKIAECVSTLTGNLMAKIERIK